MENQRLFLYIGLVFILALIWQAWEADYGQPAQSRAPTPASEAGQPAGDVPAAQPPADVPPAVDAPVPRPGRDAIAQTEAEFVAGSAW